VVRRVIRERIKSVSEKEKQNTYNWRKEENSERTLGVKNAAVGFQRETN
jgi:hypothetical protein